MIERQAGHHQDWLHAVRRELDEREQAVLAPLACASRQAVRRVEERLADHRQAFAQDADRILHSRAYTRYIDKTQVFSLVDNDHISHRVLHVQLVSRIGRTIGRFLGLNEDLIEAVALGHDIGHPPFGHEGERMLSKICRRHGLASFQHNIQSVQFLDRFERGGAGWNLTLQVLDGILCHDGEVHARHLRPDRRKDFAGHDREIAAKLADPALPLVPMTLEGCVVRLADTIAYIGRDFEDAIELGLVVRDEIPEPCRRVLGASNGTIVYTLVTDLLASSAQVRGAAADDADSDCIGFSEEVGAALSQLKEFNYRRIYANPAFKPDFDRIQECYERLFAHYLDLAQRAAHEGIDRSFLRSMSPAYVASHSPAAMVRDYLAGMTDAYFLRQAAAIGCAIPERLCLPK
ncbi:deoxyguanosinetriphosphate triphosphohydrolase family protein [Desulfobulbus elongatus]|uniref:deoxyguanosinetriphosphate triphosphohydrolase family protein n=1 Tax=Desulfobulbus elongatus TaxID=53332 RepID=UPI00068883F9|nr:HD domain-containing protein [Desulfobulbus elongatus]